MFRLLSHQTGHGIRGGCLTIPLNATMPPSCMLRRCPYSEDWRFALMVMAFVGPGHYDERQRKPVRKHHTMSKASSQSGGGGKGGGKGPGGLPSTTGRPSGGGRTNMPPKGK